MGKSSQESQARILEKEIRAGITFIDMEYQQEAYDGTHKGNPDPDGCSEFEGKSKKLCSALFSAPTSGSLNIPGNFVSYNQDLSDNFLPITPSEICKALNALNHNSAVGKDRLTFSTLSKLNAANPNILPLLSTALFKYGCHHREWKTAFCVIIPKSGESSYSTAKAYRPISLLSCLGKLLERIAASRIAKAVSICGAITKVQSGNKDGHSANDALLKTLSQICPFLAPPRPGFYRLTLRPSLAAHDILGAFNNTRPDALVRIMSLRRMPLYLIEWVKDFTENRYLSFSFDGKVEPPQPFRNAILQGFLQSFFRS
jgi:hypothetical protein